MTAVESIVKRHEITSTQVEPHERAIYSYSLPEYADDFWKYRYKKQYLCDNSGN